MTTLLRAELSRIKQRRGWLFPDATRNKSRRRCEMKICGNRARQRRFGARARRA
jgi:predicted RNA-binding Zn ribbon-like protein